MKSLLKPVLCFYLKCQDRPEINYCIIVNLSIFFYLTPHIVVTEMSIWISNLRCEDFVHCGGKSNQRREKGNELRSGNNWKGAEFLKV